MSRESGSDGTRDELSAEAAAASIPDESGSEAIGRSGPGFGRALSWSYALTGGRSFMTLGVSLVIARLLGPEAFGIIAMATVFVLFIEMFVRQGLVAAIVQRPQLTGLHLDTAFWITAATVTALVPVTVALSGWWARVNDMPPLQPVIMVLSSLLLFKGLGVVQEAQIRRKMDFRLLAVRTNTAVLLGGLSGIASALLGAGLWALVVQQLVTAAIELVLIWQMSDWRPRRRFERKCATELLSFSARSALAALGNFVNLRSDALLIGLFFGPVVVGLYRMAVRFIDLSLELAAGALQAVFLPELARFADDREAFNDRTVEVVRIGSLLAVPILGALAASSDPLIALVGEEWEPAAAALRVLCILAAVQAMSMFLGPILQAAGRPGVLAWLTWTSAVLSSLTFVASGLLLGGYSIERQVVLLAAIRTAVFVPTLFVIVLPVLSRTLALRGRRVLVAIWPASVSAVVGYGVVWAARAVFGDAWLEPPLVGIALAGLAAGISAIGVLMLIEPLARSMPQLVLSRIRSRRRLAPEPIESGPASDGPS